LTIIFTLEVLVVDVDKDRLPPSAPAAESFTCSQNSMSTLKSAEFRMDFACDSSSSSALDDFPFRISSTSLVVLLADHRLDVDVPSLLQLEFDQSFLMVKCQHLYVVPEVLKVLVLVELLVDVAFFPADSPSLPC
jgi:hypothetical protein